MMCYAVYRPEVYTLLNGNGDVCQAQVYTMLNGNSDVSTTGVYTAQWHC